MYAEERQQAMAQLISRRGRLSVVQLAGEFEVTTETVRRDLSTLDRMGVVRRVHGGAVPAGSLTVIESGIVERDQSNTQAKEADRQRRGRPPAAARLGRRHRRRQHHGPLRRRPPPRPPPDRHHPRGPGRHPPRRPAADPAPPAARQGAPGDPRRRRRRDGRRARASCAPTSPSWRPTASPSATASPPPTATRPRASGRSSPAPGKTVVLADSTKLGVETARALRHPRQHRRAGHRQRDRRPGPPCPGTSRNRGGDRMILTLTPNPSIDRTVALDGELSRGQVHRVASVTSQGGGKGVNISRAAVSAGIPSIAVVPAAQGRPVRPRAAHRRHRLPSGAPGRRRTRQPHDHRARRHHHQAQLARRAGRSRCTSS